MIDSTNKSGGYDSTESTEWDDVTIKTMKGNL